MVVLYHWSYLDLKKKSTSFTFSLLFSLRAFSSGGGVCAGGRCFPWAGSSSVLSGTLLVLT